MCIHVVIGDKDNVDQLLRNSLQQLDVVSPRQEEQRAQGAMRRTEKDSIPSFDVMLIFPN